MQNTLKMNLIAGGDFWSPFFKKGALFHKKCPFWLILNAALNIQKISSYILPTLVKNGHINLAS